MPSRRPAAVGAPPALLVTASVALAVATGCEAPPSAPVTYHGDVKAIVDAKCAGCHHEGGIAPIPLTTYDEIVPFAEVVRGAVESGTMPPWKAGDGCNTYANDFSLTDTELATLTTWLDEGLREGDARRDELRLTTPGREGTSPGIRVDALLDAADAPYAPRQNDEYRCFAIAWPHDDVEYITGFDMIPGDASNVHHVNIFLNPPREDADFVALDDADPLPGYSCSKGSSVLGSALVGAWAPGASGIQYPAGTGQLVEPGSSITLEVHYAIGGPGAVPDASQLALQLAPSVERRGMGAGFWWFNHWDEGGMPIPAGADDVTHELTVDPSLELAVVAPWITSRLIDVHVAALHMHQLGKSGEIQVRSPVGDTCLVNVPDWDFHWQTAYELEEPAELFLGEDELYLRCTFDNSAANQPVVDGVQQAPEDRNWGHRTVDEMCIGFLYLVPRQ